jgi:hypothetical protein
MAESQIAAPVSTEPDLWLSEPKTVHNSSCMQPPAHARAQRRAHELWLVSMNQRPDDERVVETLIGTRTAAAVSVPEGGSK